VPRNAQRVKDSERGLDKGSSANSLSRHSVNTDYPQDAF
jgi:hypothetical protein